MAEDTTISWCDHTWSPWYGCTQVSMGAHGACEGCYARFLSETRHKRVIFGGPGRGEGTRDARADSAWKEPLKWDRQAAADYKSWDECHRFRANPPPRSMCDRFIFPSMCDPFDNHPALPPLRRRFFDLIRVTPNLTWLLLTKRPGNIVKQFTATYWPDHVDPTQQELRGDWPKNAAIGFTAVTQEEFDRDWPKAKAAFEALSAPFIFVSYEPAMGGLVLPGDFLALRGRAWVIAGGETDQGSHRARAPDPAWFRALRDQCLAAGVTFHFKQWGRWTHPGDQEMGEALANPHDAYDVHRFGEDRWVERHGREILDAGTLDGVLHHDRPKIAA